MIFFLGLAFGIAVGALVGARSPSGLRQDLKTLLNSWAPATGEATERVEDGLAERLKHAQSVYEGTLESTRARLHRELNSARAGK